MLPSTERRQEGEQGAVSEANKELVRRPFEEIFNRKNFALCDEMMAEEYLEHAQAPFSESAPGRVKGPRAMRQSAEWLLAQFPDLHMTIEAMIAEGDTVAVRVLSEGTNLGPLNGVEGHFEFVLGERKVNAGAGWVVYVPRTTVHAFTNIGTEKGKILFIETPAGALEQFLEETGEPVSDPSSPPQGPPDMDKLQVPSEPGA